MLALWSAKMKSCWLKVCVCVCVYGWEDIILGNTRVWTRIINRPKSGYSPAPDGHVQIPGVNLQCKWAFEARKIFFLASVKNLREGWFIYFWMNYFLNEERDREECLEIENYTADYNF